MLLDNHGLLSIRCLLKRARIELVWKMLKALPALAVQAIARAGPRVAVRIVDCRADRAGRGDDGRRLEIVTRDALALHAEDRLGNVGEAVPVELARNIETA